MSQVVQNSVVYIATSMQQGALSLSLCCHPSIGASGRLLNALKLNSVSAIFNVLLRSLKLTVFQMLVTEICKFETNAVSSDRYIYFGDFIVALCMILWSNGDSWLFWGARH